MTETPEGSVIDLLKILGGPGSISLLVTGVAIGLGLRYVWPRHRRIARWWFGLLLGAYVVMALPVVATGLADALPQVSSTAVGHVDVLVVFDGDNRRGRARMAVDVFRSSPSREVWVLGNGWLVEPMSEGGVTRNRIWHDANMRTTRDQMDRLRRLLADRPGARVAVVVSRLQAPRVARLLAAQKLPVALIASPADVEPPTRGAGRFVPSYGALRLSREALYEHAALWYYRYRGWT